MADRLKERVALVTGAATGIGRATIDRLTSEGAIVIAGIADDSQRHDMASFEAVMLDVRSEADWGRAVAHVEQQHGGLTSS
jgi:NAD(P)-dependent dehydrogenase (short-subunit alcohol dehydrogenase family)